MSGEGKTIPEDIFQTACGIVMEAKSLKSMLKHRDVVDAIATAIHDAVMAERERCAEIAEDTGRSYCSYSEHSDGAGYYACGEAAAAIRNDKPPKQPSLPSNDDDLPF